MALEWRHQEYLDWLLTPPGSRDPATKQEMADKIGVNIKTLQGWQREADFLDAWEKQYRKVVGSPEKAHQVLEALHETATDRTDPRQVPAARAYLEAIDAIKPKKLDVTVMQTDAKGLTDEQLLSILAQRAATEIENREMDRA
jgi:hypothetical protein